MKVCLYLKWMNDEREIWFGLSFIRGLVHIEYSLEKEFNALKGMNAMRK